MPEVQLDPDLVLPDREVLLLAAFTAVVGSLLLQGSTLPWLVRRIGLPGPDPAEDALRAAELGDAEREVVIRARDDGTAPGEVLSAALAAIDVEESLLDRQEELESLARDRALAPAPRGGRCTHLESAPVGEPHPASACQDCLVEGTTWVHLRTCLSCGHVGCCDSSPRRHSRAHFGAEGHPVVVSAEPGEAWRWCWVDEELG